MKVRCIKSSGADLSPADIAAGHYTSSTFYVSVGGEYVVYGVAFDKGAISYLIEDDTGYIRWYPASLFEITSDRVSRLWRFSSVASAKGYEAQMSFAELVQNLDFFTRLVDGEKAAEDIFYRWKQMADLEFPDPSVTAIATIGDSDWLLCPFCADAWKSNGPDALVQCGVCKKVSNNPRYQGS